MKSVFDVVQDKKYIDSTVLLTQYFISVKKTNSNFNELSIQSSSCLNYIKGLSYKIDVYFSKKKDELIAENIELNDKLELLKKNINKAASLTELSVYEKENEELSIKLTNDYETYKKEIAALNDLIERLNIILFNIKNIKKLISKLRLKFLCCQIRQILINVISFFCIAFILSYCFDFVQNLSEATFKWNHLKVLLIGFMLQTYLIDPFILSRLKSKLNWQLIDILKTTIPELEKEILEEKAKFNSILDAVEEFKKFKV